MFIRWLPARRWGRSGSRDFVLLLCVLFVLSMAVARLLGPDGQPDAGSLGQRILTTLWGLVQCFGLVVGVGFILALLEMLKHQLARSRARRLDDQLAGLVPLTQDVRTRATSADLTTVLRHLSDANFALRYQAIRAAYCLLRADPKRVITANIRALLERTLSDACGFTQTMADTPLSLSLLQRVTLGGKLGAGTVEKRLAPVTSEPIELAQWVEFHRRELPPFAELQVSIGYDTGPLPSVEERARFIALYLFIATTNLDRFQALVRRPHRDPNAAFGVVIRGDIVEPRFPGQRSGHRLDYVFPLPEQLSTTNLAGLFAQIQILNLGLLCACAAHCGEIFLGKLPVWVDDRRLALARLYEDFERRLIRLLRSLNVYRDPQFIHPLDPSDHEERVAALAQYRLEECLFPPYRWIVPLYSLDTRWDRLLAPLRVVEAMLLHQGTVQGQEQTRGSDFIRQVRQLGYRTAESLTEALLAAEPVLLPALPLDPFIDPADEDATRYYLLRTGRALSLGVTHPEDLPDPVTFRKAADYYAIPLDQPSGTHRGGFPEEKP